MITALVSVVLGFLLHPVVEHFAPKVTLTVDLAVTKLLGK